MNTEQNVDSMEGIIKNVISLDLTGMKAEDLDKIKMIKNVVFILVPESLKTSLMSIQKENVVDIVTVPDQANIKSFTGDIRMDGEEMSNSGGDPDRDILLVCGELFIESPVTSVGFKQVIISGSLIAPKESRAVISSAITRMVGETVYYKDSTRKINGMNSFSKEYFELLPSGDSLLILGKVEIEEDVTKELVKEKISEIFLTGELIAPKHLIPILQILIVENYGILKTNEKEQSGS